MLRFFTSAAGISPLQLGPRKSLNSLPVDIAEAAERPADFS